MDWPWTAPALGLAGPLSAALVVMAAVFAWRGGSTMTLRMATAASAVSLSVTAAHLPYGDGGIYSAAWGMVEVSALLVLVAVVVRRSRGCAGGAVVLMLSVVAAATLLRVQPPPDSAGDLLHCLFWIPFVTAAAVAGMYLRSQDASHRRDVLRAETEQRLALAGDLHDFVAHEVNAMLFQAQAALLPDGDNAEQLRHSLSHIESLGQRAMSALDRSIHAMREPSAWHDLRDVRHLVDRFATTGHPAVELRIDADAERCDQDVSALAYRIVVEALTNVRRHAPSADAVSIEIHSHREQSLLEVSIISSTTSRADSVAAPERPRRAVRGESGISTLTARVEAVGGTLTAGSTGPGLWRIRAALPWEGRHA